MTLPLSVTSVYTKKNLKEMNTAVHRRTRRIYLLLCGAGVLLFVIGALLLGRIEGAGALMFAGVLWTILFLIFSNQAARKSTRNTLKSNLRNYGAPVQITAKFYNTMLVAKNDTTGAEVRSQYGDVTRLLRTKNLFVLVLEESRAVMVDQNSIEPADVEDLWELLREGCTEAVVQV